MQALRHCQGLCLQGQMPVRARTSRTQIGFQHGKCKLILNLINYYNKKRTSPQQTHLTTTCSKRATTVTVRVVRRKFLTPPTSKLSSARTSKRVNLNYPNSQKDSASTGTPAPSPTAKPNSEPRMRTPCWVPAASLATATMR